jgi:hypothetical protein
MFAAIKSDKELESALDFTAARDIGHRLVMIQPTQ